MTIDPTIFNPLDTSDVLFDYCHFPYSPATPVEGKLPSGYLLDRSFRFMKCDARFNKLVQTLKSQLGENSTVWGVKNIDGQLIWEFYFYNYGRRNPHITPSRILEAMHTFFRMEHPPACDGVRYFMFSIDVLPAYFETGKLPNIHLYFHNVEDRQTGLSYLFDGNEIRLENHYAFYRPASEQRALRQKVADSAILDPSRILLEHVLIPELTDCHTICIANKQDCDAVYFSRIDVNQFLFFLRRFGYDEELIDVVDRDQSLLDHLRYDVGFDYFLKGGELIVKKSGYYGTF
jgi:hypothetical protein